MSISDPDADVTALLRQVAAGDKSAEAQLLPLVYKELRRIAANYMRREAPDHTLQTTALVHEAYIRLTNNSGFALQNRVHFFAVAATVMRHILVDYARARNADRRGGTVVFLPDFPDAPAPGESPQILALNDALDRLAALDRRQARVVELRYLAGMTVEEVAEALNLSPRTVKRDWQLAKAWLYGELAS